MYWTGVVDAGGAVLSAPLAGGATTTLASLGEYVGDSVAVDSAAVYWIDAPAFATSHPVDSLMSVPLRGGAVATILSGPNVPFLNIVVVGASIYGTGAAVTSMPIGGGTVTTLASTPDEAPGVALAVDAESAYWLADGKVLRVSRAGGPVTTLVSGRQDMFGMAMDATAVYWTERQGGRVMKVVKP